GDSSEDPENFGDEKRELILDVMEDSLSDEWFTGMTTWRRIEGVNS
ncbi:hypothetical protein Tco_1339220, partial [Tanacetum coccineum]